MKQQANEEDGDITEDEHGIAINKLKNGKAAGDGRITTITITEMIRCLAAQGRNLAIR